jgi:hypothetical protein
MLDVAQQRNLSNKFPNIFDQDITYCYNVDKNTYDNSRLKQIFDELRPLNHSIIYRKKKNKILKRNRLIEELELIGRRFYYDQSVFDERKNQVIRPIGKIRKIDRITIQGMGRMSSIFANESTGFYAWMVNGGSSISAEVTDWKLYNEFATCSIIDNGYMSGSGTVVKHGASFSINDESNTIKECGVRDFPTFNPDQTLWFRSVLDVPGDEIEHVQGKDVVIISHAAHFISVSDFEEEVEHQVI